jgi:hypothetical protein
VPEQAIQLFSTQAQAGWKARIKSMDTELIILGRGSPNKTKDGRKTLCAIGLSKEIGLVRVYPVNAEARQFRLWNRIKVKLKKNEKDNRPESFYLDHDFYSQPSQIKVVETIKDSADKLQILDSCELQSGETDPIDFCNQNKMSIALVRPEKNQIWGVVKPNDRQRNDRPEDGEQEWLPTQEQAPFIYQIGWQSIQGKNHTQSVVSFEFHEAQRKFEATPYALLDNAKISSKDYQKWFLLGNQNNKRNSFLIVHVHRFLEHDQGFMLPCCDILSGNPAGWPYFVTGGRNVKNVGPQMDLFKSTTLFTESA